jgi:hypothetical protein
VFAPAWARECSAEGSRAPAAHQRPPAVVRSWVPIGVLTYCLARARSSAAQESTCGIGASLNSHHPRRLAQRHSDAPHTPPPDVTRVQVAHQGRPIRMYITSDVHHAVMFR